MSKSAVVAVALLICLLFSSLRITPEYGALALAQC
jgi:hypothetical protein